jgi:hypothetical protein
MPGEWTSGFGAGPPTPAMSEADLRCSFCGKRRDEVAKMIAGQRWQIGQHSRLVAICNDCVTLCAEMFAEQDPRDAPA